MEHSKKNSGCTTRCWLIAAILGVIVAVVLWKMREWGFVQGAFVGLLIFIIGGALLSWMMCKPLPVTAATASATSGTTNSPTTTAVVGGAAVATAAGAAIASTDNSEAKTEETTSVAEDTSSNKTVTSEPEETSADAKSTATPDVPAKKPVTLKPETKTAAKSKSVGSDATLSKTSTAKSEKPAKTVKTKSADVTKAPTPKVATKKATSKAKPIAADGKPETLSAPRDGGADDLKQLKGVGPALEKTLNELGFYHFDQVASWRKKEIAWVDGNLRFKGRIERDEWTKQAKILAKGGTTEFSSKVKKGGVY